MKKIVLLILVLMVVAGLWSFVPQRRDFASEYQYRLYRSWYARQIAQKELPARITHDLIERQIKFADEDVEVVYIWDNWKIYRQWENLPDWLPYSNFQTELSLAGELLYRLNCRHSLFAVHYLNSIPVELSYDNYIGETAVDSLFARYSGQRLMITNLHPVTEQDRLTKIILVMQNGDELTLSFGDLSNIDSLLKEMKSYEWNFAQDKLPDDFKTDTPDIVFVPERKVYTEMEIEIIEAEEIIEESPYKDIIQQPADSLLTDYEETLLAWIDQHQDTIWGSEMLNNKITDIGSFLQQEFPEHSMLIKDDTYNLFHKRFQKNIPADLYLKVKENSGWSILASEDVTLNKKLAVVSGYEDFDLSALDDYEAECISQFLPHLLISHRVINSRLAGFILQPDMIGTTLVVNGSERKVYSMRSYHDLLLLLGNFWKDRTIYYTVNDFRIIDGYIEFKGYLAAEDDSHNYDLAEIRYRLDEDYMMVLAMMILFPEQSSQELKGR